MACCGDDPDTKQQGVVQQRKCRDVLCLLFFIAFWVGMFIVCAMAYKEGDSNRLVYGIDSHGFTCGGQTTFKGVTLDLSNSKNLYYLNPLDLLSVVNIPYAKKICVNGCPSSTTLCSAYGLPCTQNSQFQCPYYRFAEDNLYGKLSNVQDVDTAYFSALPTMASTTDSQATALINQLVGLNIPWINTYLSSYNITGSGPITGYYYQLQSQIPGKGPCYPVWVPTTDYFHRCFPSYPSNLTSEVVSLVNGVASVIGDDALNAFKDKWNSLSDRFARYIADISKGILLIVVAGLVGGVVLSLIWLIILRYLAGFMAWMTIILVNLVLIGITLYCFSLAGMLGDNEVSKDIASNLPGFMDGVSTSLEKDQWKWIAIGSAVVAGIVLLITLLMIRRIRIAVACIKVASQAVGAMPSILLFPLLPFVLEVGLLIYWIAVTAMLYTAGDLTANCRSSTSHQPFNWNSLKNLSASSLAPSFNSSSSTASCYNNVTRDEMISYCAEDPNCYLSYNWNSKLQYAFIYHFFGLLWTNQFIVGFSCVTVAGAIAYYYWSQGDTAQMPALPVLAALKNTVVYHLGSIAFGSFIVAVIMFIRFLLEYLDRKTRDLQAANKCAEWAMCCVKCCMWCLEKIVMFINKNAYIMVGVKGTSYCVSAGRAVALIVQNALRLITVNFVGDILIFLGKVGVAAGCGLIAFGMSEISYYNDPTKYPDTYLASPVLCVAISVITGFVVAQIFFSVYDMAIDTIILAFCEDCESNGGNPRYAPPLLMEAMGMAATSKVAPAPAPAK